MHKHLVTVLLGLLFLQLSAQNAEIKYASHWQNAGQLNPFTKTGKLINAKVQGADANGVKPCDSIVNALIKLVNPGDTIYFPAGNYLFNKILQLKDSSCIKGDGQTTQFIFDLKSGNNAIQGSGGIDKALRTIGHGLKAGDQGFFSPSSPIAAGSWIQIVMNDSGLVTSDWAKNSVSEIVQVTRFQNDTLYFFPPLKIDYPKSRNPNFHLIYPFNHATLQCFSILRKDSTLDQNSNINFNYAFNCRIRGVYSQNCNYAHIALDNSAFNTIEQCYFTNSYGYGGGGKGYGIAIQTGSCENLISNSIFNHLRHSILFQSGANGNVISYNYSLNPFWTEASLPSASAGDIVLHGNFPFANLIEGNICQNIIIDDTHGKNGPDNTFFRNRAELYGIFMNTNPATDNQGFINNEVTNTGFLMGLYNLAGSGHRQIGNMVRGSFKPTGSKPLTDSSFYLSAAPAFWPVNWPWPFCGNENSTLQDINPAKGRFKEGIYTHCSQSPVYSSISEIKSTEIQVFPNPVNHTLYLTGIKNGTEIQILDMQGRILLHSVWQSGSADCSNLAAGLYVLKTPEKTVKFIKTTD